MTSIRADLRALRLRALEAGPARIVITLGPDAALDPAKLADLVARGGRYRLTPDMKLVVKIEPDLGGERLLEAARSALRDLARCAA